MGEWSDPAPDDEIKDDDDDYCPYCEDYGQDCGEHGDDAFDDARETLLIFDDPWIKVQKPNPKYL